MSTPDFTLSYSSGQTAAFSTQSARWIMAIGGGTVVMTNAGSPSSATSTSTGTYAMTSGQVLTGEWSALVSTNCTALLVGSGNNPPAPQPSLAAVVPGTSVQAYVEDTTPHSAAFSTTVGYVHFIDPSGATFAYTMPAVSAANNGQQIAVVNVSVGSTATVAAPTGNDNIGNSAAGATGATAAGPTGGAAVVYTASVAQGAWLVGI